MVPPVADFGAVALAHLGGRICARLSEVGEDALPVVVAVATFAFETLAVWVTGLAEEGGVVGAGVGWGDRGGGA